MKGFISSLFPFHLFCFVFRCLEVFIKKRRFSCIFVLAYSTILQRNPYSLLTGLEEAGQYVDHLYIQFYNNYCHTGAGQWFTDTLNKWLAFAERMKPRGPLIFIGLPADTKGASGAQFYRPPGELRSLYQVRGGLFEVFLFLAPVVQRVDNFIQRISLSSG